jgi:hypothetical protein
MIFLVEYDRNAGAMLSFKHFADEQRHRAEDERLVLELQLNQAGLRHEVVLLEAVDEAALRRTHQRYFQTLEQLAESSLALLAEEPIGVYANRVDDARPTRAQGKP